MTKSEAIIHQLNRLPEPYRTQALNNHKWFPLNPVAVENNAPPISSPDLAIAWGFVLDRTPEGREYWNAAKRQFDYHYFKNQEATQP